MLSAAANSPSKSKHCGKLYGRSTRMHIHPAFGSICAHLPFYLASRRCTIYNNPLQLLNLRTSRWFPNMLRGPKRSPTPCRWNVSSVYETLELPSLCSAHSFDKTARCHDIALTRPHPVHEIRKVCFLALIYHNASIPELWSFHYVETSDFRWVVLRTLSFRSYLSRSALSCCQ